MSKVVKAQSKFIDAIGPHPETALHPSDLANAKALEKAYKVVEKRFRALTGWTELISGDYAAINDLVNRRDAVWVTIYDFVEAQTRLMTFDSVVGRPSELTPIYDILRLLITNDSQIRAFNYEGERTWFSLFSLILDVPDNRDNIEKLMAMRRKVWELAYDYARAVDIESQGVMDFYAHTLFVGPRSITTCSGSGSGAGAPPQAVSAMRWAPVAWGLLIEWLFRNVKDAKEAAQNWHILFSRLLPELFPRLLMVSGYRKASEFPRECDHLALAHPLAVEVLRVLTNLVAPNMAAAATSFLTGAADPTPGIVDGMAWPPGASALAPAPAGTPYGAPFASSRSVNPDEADHPIRCDELANVFRAAIGGEGFTARASEHWLGDLPADGRFGFARISVSADNILFLAIIHLTPGSDAWCAAATALRLRAAVLAAQLRQMHPWPCSGTHVSEEASINTRKLLCEAPEPNLRECSSLTTADQSSVRLCSDVHALKISLARTDPIPAPSAPQETYPGSPFGSVQHMLLLSDASNIQLYFRAICTALTCTATVAVPPSAAATAACGRLPYAERFLGSEARAQRWEGTARNGMDGLTAAQLADRAAEQVGMVVAMLGSCLASACPLPGPVAWESVTRALGLVTAAAITDPTTRQTALSTAPPAGPLHHPHIPADISRAAAARLALVPVRCQEGPDSRLLGIVTSVLAPRKNSVIVYGVWGQLVLSMLRAATITTTGDCREQVLVAPVLTSGSATQSAMHRGDLKESEINVMTATVMGSNRPAVRPACYTLVGGEITHCAAYLPDDIRSSRQVLAQSAPAPTPARNSTKVVPGMAAKQVDLDARKRYLARLRLTGGAAAAADDAYPDAAEELPELISAPTSFTFSSPGSVLMSEMGFSVPIHGTDSEGAHSLARSRHVAAPVLSASPSSVQIVEYLRVALSLIGHPLVAPTRDNTNAPPHPLLLNYASFIISTVVLVLATPAHNVSLDAIFSLAGPWLLRLATFPCIAANRPLGLATPSVGGRAATMAMAGFDRRTVPATAAAITALGEASFRVDSGGSAEVVAAVTHAFGLFIALVDSDDTHPAFKGCLTSTVLPAVYSPVFSHIVTAHAPQLARIAHHVAVSPAQIDQSVRATAVRLLGQILALPSMSGSNTTVTEELAGPFNSLCEIAAGKVPQAEDTETRVNAVLALGRIVHILVNEITAPSAGIEPGTEAAEAAPAAAPAPGVRKRGRLNTAAFTAEPEPEPRPRRESVSTPFGAAMRRTSTAPASPAIRPRPVPPAPAAPAGSTSHRTTSWVPDSDTSLPPPPGENPPLACYPALARAAPVRAALAALCAAALPSPTDQASASSYYRINNNTTAGGSTARLARVTKGGIVDDAADPAFAALTELGALAEDARVPTAFAPGAVAKVEASVPTDIAEARARSLTGLVVDTLIRQVVYVVYAKFAGASTPTPQITSRLLRLVVATLETIGDWLTVAEGAGYSVLAVYSTHAQTEHAESWTAEDALRDRNLREQERVELARDLMKRIPPPVSLQKLTALVQIMTLNSFPHPVISDDPDLKLLCRHLNAAATALEMRIAIVHGARAVGLGAEAGTLPVWTTEDDIPTVDCRGSITVCMHRHCIATLTELAAPTADGARVRIVLRSPAGKFVYYATPEPGFLPKTLPHYTGETALMPRISGPASVGPGTTLAPGAPVVTSAEVAAKVAAGVEPPAVGDADKSFLPANSLRQPVTSHGRSYFDAAQADLDAAAIAMRDAELMLESINTANSTLCWDFNSLLHNRDIAVSQPFKVNMSVDDAVAVAGSCDVLGSLDGTDNVDPSVIAAILGPQTAMAAEQTDTYDKLVSERVNALAKNVEEVRGVLEKAAKTTTSAGNKLVPPAAPVPLVPTEEFGPAPRLSVLLTQLSVLDLCGTPAPGMRVSVLPESEGAVRKKLRRIDRHTLVHSTLAMCIYADAYVAAHPDTALAALPSQAAAATYYDFYTSLGWDANTETVPSVHRLGLEADAPCRYWGNGTRETVWAMAALMPEPARAPAARAAAAAVVYIDPATPNITADTFVAASGVAATVWYFVRPSVEGRGAMATVTPYYTTPDETRGPRGLQQSFIIPSVAVGAFIRGRASHNLSPPGTFGDVVSARVEAIAAAAADARPLEALDALDMLMG